MSNCIKFSQLFGILSSQSCLFDTDVGSPSRPSIWSAQPSDIRPKEVPTSSSTTNNNEPNSLGAPASLMHHKAVFRTVEELERDLMKKPVPVTMEELELKLLDKQGPFEIGQQSPENVQNEFNVGQHATHTCRIVPPPNLQAPFLRLPPPIGMLMPPPVAAVPVPMPVPMQLPLPGVHLRNPLLLPPLTMQWPLRIPPSTSAMPSPRYVDDEPKNPARGNNNGQVGLDNSDEYNGLMSTKEKQWLMSIQINQLISDNPYVDDYYFTVLRLRCFGQLHQGADCKQGCKLIIPGRVKAETKTYAPTQFANSLGKLQVVTYTAPRRIIDVGISQSLTETVQDSFVAMKETRKFKQILLDVEKMYCWLMELEDAEMRIESLPANVERGPHHQVVADCRNKLQAFLSLGERVYQTMLVRKGKVTKFFLL